MNPAPETVAAAVILFVAMAAYALFDGADFGGGIWDLLAGGTERGAEPRAAIDASVTPVWEGNHTWIVFGLVVFWTAFPPAFGAVMTALFTPLFLSLVGIFFRGIGFAFRHEASRLSMKRLSGATFAASSFIAPFFLGAVFGAVATGKVPAHPAGTVPAAWTSPTAVMTGLLFVAACAYIGAVYLVGDCRRRGEPEMVRYFRVRAIAAGLVTGVLALINMVLLSSSAPYVFHRLIGPALPLVALSVAAGIVALVLVMIRRYFLLRVAAALAVVAVVGGWGWAQYPWLLPGQLTLAQGSAPMSTLHAEFAVVGLAVLLVVPAFVFLYWLQQHGRLGEDEVRESLLRATAAQNRPARAVVAASAVPAHPRPAAPSATRTARRGTVAVLMIAALVELARILRERRRR